MLAQVDSRTIAASDVALARALGVFGLAPSSSPITRAEVDRFVEVLLILAEAGRIGIEVEPAALDVAWAAVATRAGGEAALTRWLEENAIDRDWARRLVGEDIVKSKFLDARFAAFVFPDEETVTRELGPGQHDEERAGASAPAVDPSGGGGGTGQVARRRAAARFDQDLAVGRGIGTATVHFAVSDLSGRRRGQGQ